MTCVAQVSRSALVAGGRVPVAAEPRQSHVGLHRPLALALDVLGIERVQLIGVVVLAV
jgi:hypothetical protein